MSTFSKQIDDGNDDAQESNGSMNLTGSNLNANGTTHLSGMRFVGVTIPQGSTISAASLDLYLPSGSFDDPDVTLSGEAVDDAAVFSSANNDIGDRTQTTATVTWQATALGTGIQTTPDLSALVEEIVGRSGWSSGNALVVIITGNNSNSALRWAAEDGSNPAATLDVVYSGPGGGSSVAVKAMYYRMGLAGV